MSKKTVGAVGKYEPPAILSPKGALLQALVRGDSYGLELIDCVKELTEGKVVLHQGTVYPALRALEKEGLVESYESEPLQERGGRPRVYYSLTAAGRKISGEQRTAALGLLGVSPAAIPAFA